MRRAQFLRAGVLPGVTIPASSPNTEGDSFRADKPRPVAETLTTANFPGRPYDVHPDGQRFAVATAPENTGARQDKVVIVSNFFDELKRLVPVK